MLAQDLIQIIESVWQTTVGAELVSLPLDSHGIPPTGALTSTIYFKGSWPGLLMCTVSETLGRRIAAAMFGQSADACSAEDIRDSVGEIVNILGGNLKAILPPPCTLSLPAVFDGDIGDLGVVPTDAEFVDELWFESDGERMVVRLVKDRAALKARAS
jgi:chemotaxis protein CheX